MTEILQKYELLTLFPLTGTEEELKQLAGKIEERVRSAGGTIAASNSLHKGKLMYPISHVRQGYYHSIQFEINPVALEEFTRQLILTGEVLRFTLTRSGEEFKPFVPTDIRAESPKRERRKRVVSTERSMATIDKVLPTTHTAPAVKKQAAQLTQKDAVVPEKAEKLADKKEPKISIEEIDKKLEEILGSEN